MNGKMANKLRKIARKEAVKRDHQILPELKVWINDQQLSIRAKIAWKILWRKF